jgi:hypothetical protein
MGNFALKCKTCSNQNIEPQYFTKTTIVDPSNNDNLLIQKIDKYDKYGNKLDDNLQPIPPQPLYYYTCSNGHRIDSE